MNEITYEDVKNSSEFQTYIQAGDQLLGTMGFTKHDFAHSAKVTETSAHILKEFGYEGSGSPVNIVSAALILADKTDVRRSRVRNLDFATFDIHDRVNYAVEKAEVHVANDSKSIQLNLIVDTKICSLMEYFEIFLTRMLLCRKAADYLGAKFELIMNGTKIL